MKYQRNLIKLLKMLLGMLQYQHISFRPPTQFPSAYKMKFSNRP